MRAMLLALILAVATTVAADQAVPAQGGAPMTGEKTETAVFAGGCFWCVEADFLKVPGVVEAVSGYAGGQEPNPTYEQVSGGRTGHLEAVRVRFDPDRVSYATLVEFFWRTIDPTDARGQFCDQGPQYRSAVFVADPAQRAAAEASKARLEASGRLPRVATEILAFTTFYPAEEYHQNYAKAHALKYGFYRYNCGRDARLRELWGEEAGKVPAPALSPAGSFVKPSAQALRARLTPMQFTVTQEEGTEPPFSNAYWDEKRDGVYVDVVSGEPLFSSRDKYDSGTGWPSFTRPLEPGNIVEKEDRRFFSVRTEVRSRGADSHLGHVFPDGPAPTGLRYCLNSAALRFVPREDLEKEGLGRYLDRFAR